MGYSQKNSKGNTYHLHSRDVGSKGAKLYFFSKNEEGSVDLPETMQVIEAKTGMLMVKRKQ